MTANAMAKVDGSTRAAILLMTIGERLAAEVLRHLNPKEVQKIGLAMAGLQGVSRQEVATTLEEFLKQVLSRTPLGIGTEDYLRKTLTGALGKDKAQNLIGRIMAGERLSGLEALRWMDPPAIARLVRNEHPQIVAIVLAHLDPDQSAEVLSLFPESQRADLVMRVANLESVPPSALTELDAILDQKVTDNPSIQSSRIGGLTTAVNLLNLLDRSMGTEIMDSIKEQDPDLAVALDEALFTFEDLADTSDRGIQTLLKEISNNVLVTALKGSDDAIKEKIFKNMSKRAALLLRDDLEGTGPVRLSEVEHAQKEIIAIARKLAEAGELALGKGDDYV
ncbi:MAG: flagellar motor switch protein FliG [Chromatiaceae bacterium]